MKKSMPPQAAEELSRQLDKFLEDTKSNQSGSDVVVTASIDTKGLSDKLGPMMGPVMAKSMMAPALGGQAVAAGGPRPGTTPRVQPRAAPPGGSGLIGNIRGSAYSTQHTNNLKQLALAMMNYHDTYGRFPPAFISENGKPLLSWRVALLPFLEHGPVYNQFHLKEPWDSPHNKRLLRHMPKLFALPGSPPGMTTTTPYQVFVGAHTPWPGDGHNGLTMVNFTDGTSNTILIAEAANLVEWTKPEDMTLQPGQSPKELFGQGVKPNTSYVVMADGSTRAILLSTVSDETLRNAIDPADGHPLGQDFGP
jgi:hypothetical protein